MKHKTSLFTALVIGALLAGTGLTRSQSATAFTYQGNLSQNGAGATGSFDFQFALFTNSTGGNAVMMVTNSAVTVSNGLFTAVVDFGNVFTGASSFLDIAVRPNGTAAGFSELPARQPFTASPFSLRTLAQNDFLFVYDTTSQAFTSSANNYQTITFNTPGPLSPVGGQISGWTPSVIGTSSSTFTALDAGLYLFQYQAELTGTIGRTATFRGLLNNTSTDLAGSEAAVTLGTNVTQVSKSFMANLNSNDVFRLQFTVDGTTVNLTPAGVLPNIRPSVSMTVTRVN